jgi:hypothetical protein
MKIYEIEFIHVIERLETVVVVAKDDNEAIQKAKDGDWIETVYEDAPEEGVETKDYEIVSVRDDNSDILNTRDKN